METNTGIYQIYFTEEIPKRYIGSTINLKQRRRDHKSKLENGKHYNKPLQEAYNKYGINNLKFFVREYLPDGTPKADLEAVEQYWIDTVGLDNLYNIYPKAGSPEGAIATDESKLKMSEAKRGVNHPMHGIPAPNRNQEVWDNYHLIKDLHILNPELGCKSLCKLFNETFGTNYPSHSFQNILPKIKEEIVQRNS